MRDFEVIIDILKQQLNIKSSEELAKLMGIGYSNLRKRKMENNTPFKKLLVFCHDRGLNMQDIVMNDGVAPSQIETSTAIKLRRTAEQAEIAFLKSLITKNKIEGKKAIQKALFELEFMFSRTQDKKQRTHEKFTKRGKISYEGHVA